jgi:hypothetical protein
LGTSPTNKADDILKRLYPCIFSFDWGANHEDTHKKLLKILEKIPRNKTTEKEGPPITEDWKRNSAVNRKLDKWVLSVVTWKAA